MKIHGASAVLLSACGLCACSAGNDPGFEAAVDLDREITDACAARGWNVRYGGGGTSGGMAPAHNDHSAIWEIDGALDCSEIGEVLKQTVSDALRSRTGASVVMDELAGVNYTADYKHLGGDSAGWQFLYRANGYRGVVTIRVTTFPAEDVRGHIYLSHMSSR